MHIQSYFLALVASACSATASKALSSAPPMGFNNWARFECSLNETIFTTTAETMLSTGLLKAGYNRINLDDCWPLHSRSANGSLQWDSVLFPKGLIWLGQYLKSLGFHFGIYSDAGNMTCGGYPGSLGYEELDAKTFASWGVDYLKLDGCNLDPQPPLSSEGTYKKVYGHWHKVLSSLPTPVIFSESAPAYFSAGIGGFDNLTDWYSSMDWAPKYGELARHSDDIPTFFEPDPWEGILHNYGQNVLLARHQKPGFFNDPDFLIMDHPGLTLEEKKSQFTLWCSFGAPLIISAWIPGLGEEVLEFLRNEMLIEVDQDGFGLQATLVSQDGSWDVLSRSLRNGDRLLTILNRGAVEGTISVPFKRLGYRELEGHQYSVRDLLTGKYETPRKAVKVTVPSHGTAVFRISASGKGGNNITPTGVIFNTKSLHCLTSMGTVVSWSNCTGTDFQVWQVKRDRSMSSLGDTSKCLEADRKGGIWMQGCKRGNKGQRWAYYVTGNVRNHGAKNCLTEGVNGTVAAAACAFERNDQVFELPSGSLGS